MRLGFGKSSVETVRDYVAAINARDLPAIETLLSDDATLTDSGGAQVSGRKACVEIITRAFAILPEYQILIESMHGRGNEVLIRGRVEGSDPHLANPTHFRSVVVHHQVSSWESFSAQPGSVIDWLNTREFPVSGVAAAGTGAEAT